MIIRFTFFALMALGLLGFGTVLWISTRPPPQDAATIAASATVTVMTAAHAVRAGNLLKPEDLAEKTMTQSQAGPDGNVDSPSARRALSGAMVRRSLDAGDVIRMQDVMRPGDHGFLAAVLLPGMVAASVGVDAITGAAGLIWPGDRIDLILTQSIGDATLPIGRRIAAETVLRDVRVIAIDQQLIQGVAPDGAESNGRTVTMEVTPAQAERVSVATRIGALSLSVRSAENGTTAAPERTARGTTWASDVSPALGADVAQGARTDIHIFEGSAEGKGYRF